MAEPIKTKNEIKSENPINSPQAPLPSSTAGPTVTPPPPAPAAPAAPTPTPATPPAADTPEKPKKPVWIWVLAGCLVLLIISLVGIGILGWLGIRQIKSLFQKYEPTVQQTQSNLELINQEAAKWQEKSQQLRDNLPNPDDLKNMPGLPDPKDMPDTKNMRGLQNMVPQQN